MVIPFGAIVAVAGLVSIFFGARASAAQLIGGGLAMEVAAGFSLYKWRQGNPSRLITAVSAGAV